MLAKCPQTAYEVHQQLRDAAITAIVCWAAWAEIRFPSFYFSEDSHTQTQPTGDVICVVGESVQQASAVDFLTVRVWESLFFPAVRGWYSSLATC